MLTKGAEWEGLYIYSDEGTYFEVLCENNIQFHMGQVGIAFSSRTTNINPIDHLKNLSSSIDMYDVLDQNNDLWFKSFSLIDLPKNPKAYVWYIDYAKPQKELRFKKTKNKVKKFRKIVLNVPLATSNELKKFEIFPDLPKTMEFETTDEDNIQVQIRSFQKEVDFDLEVEFHT